MSDINTSAIEDYPYEIHTNQELKLLLEGTKPLAVFCVDNIEGEEHFTLAMAQSDQNFSALVHAGRLYSDHMRMTVKMEDRNQNAVLDYYAYTLIGEEWRAKAYFELMKLLHKVGWCQNLERLQGTL